MTKKAFTLSEVLITLVIIGIIAAITVPVIMNNAKWAQYRSGALKAQSVLDNALKMYHVKEGEIPQCGYWDKNPYGASKCISYDVNGNCIESVLENGDPKPSDYFGRMSDCLKVFDSFTKNLNVAKYCASNAFNNGCITDYDGIDTIYQGKNPDVTPEEAGNAVSGLAFFKKSYILSGAAIVTTDGMVFIPYSKFSVPIMLVDVNGAKGPNKWGHDMIVLTSQIRGFSDSPRFVPKKFVGSLVDKGGISTHTLIYGKD